MTIMLDEDQWLTFKVFQSQFSNWNLELHFAVYNAYDAAQRKGKDEKALVNSIDASFIDDPLLPRRDRTWEKARRQSSWLTDLSEKERRDLFSRACQLWENINDQILRQAQDLMQKALKQSRLEDLLPMTKYATWLRYSFWTAEEAAEFTSGENTGVEFEKRVKILKERYLKSFESIIPSEFISWAVGENWGSQFKRKQLEGMGSWHLDLMENKQKTSLQKLVLGLALTEFRDSPTLDGLAPKIRDRLQTKGLLLSVDSIRKLLNTAKDDLEYDLNKLRPET